MSTGPCCCLPTEVDQNWRCHQLSAFALLSSHGHALGSLQHQQLEHKSNNLSGWTLMWLPGMSLAESLASTVSTHVWHTEPVLHGCHTGTGTVRSRHGESLRFLLTACTALSTHTHRKHSKSSEGNVSKGKRRIWENTLSKMTVILTRATEGWRKRAESRNSNEKHTGLFWEAVVVSPALHF